MVNRSGVAVDVRSIVDALDEVAFGIRDLDEGRVKSPSFRKAIALLTSVALPWTEGTVKRNLRHSKTDELESDDVAQEISRLLRLVRDLEIAADSTGRRRLPHARVARALALLESFAATLFERDTRRVRELKGNSGRYHDAFRA